MQLQIYQGEDLRDDYIIPDPFDDRIPTIFTCCRKGTMRTGVSVVKELILPTPR